MSPRFVFKGLGFMKQLEIFEQLSWKADSETLNTCQRYRTWLIDSGNVPITEDEARTSLFIKDLKVILIFKQDSSIFSQFRKIPRVIVVSLVGPISFTSAMCNNT